MKTLLTALFLLQGANLLQAETTASHTPPPPASASTETLPPEEIQKMEALEQAANKGDAKAAMELGIRYAAQEKGIEARQWGEKYQQILREKAEKNDTASMIDLGSLYLLGNMTLSIPPNATESRKWWLKAAEAGHAASQYQIARMMEKGYGGPKDAEQAKQWYAKARQSLGELVRDPGKAASEDIYWLAIMEREGLGAATDLAQALAHMRQAAEKGHVHAAYRTARMYEQGTGCEASPEQALSWYRKGAELGSIDAMMMLAANYKAGHGVPQDLALSVRYLQQAAARNHPSAIYLLGKAYLSGEGIEKDPAKALACTEQLASFGYGPALLDAADMYMRGIGTARDEKKAVDMLTLAANTYADIPGAAATGAAATLALALYYDDHGNKELADTWYYIASERGVPAAMARRGLLHLLPGSSQPWNPLRAYKWWSIGAERGDETSASYKNRMLWIGIPLVIILCIIPLLIVARLNKQSLALDAEAAEKAAGKPKS